MSVPIKNAGTHNDHDGSDFDIIEQAKPKADQPGETETVKQCNRDAVDDDGNDGPFDAEGGIDAK